MNLAGIEMPGSNRFQFNAGISVVFDLNPISSAYGILAGRGLNHQGEFEDLSDEERARLIALELSGAFGDGAKLFGKAANAAKGVTNGLSKTISVQKQARHIAGTAKQGGGFLNSVDDAQAVLDAVHSGKATFLGTSKAGHQIYRFNGVTGTNVNLGAGISGQPTNVFMIKGTTSPSVVPTSPLWKP